MQYTFTIIDDSHDNIRETLSKLERFEDCFCIGTALNKQDAVNIILECQPHVVFLCLDVNNDKSCLLLDIINELYRFLNKLPYFVVIANGHEFAYDAIKAGVTDYLLRPLLVPELIKCILKIKKLDNSIPQSVKDTDSNAVNDYSNIPVKNSAATQICIKSYGDYQFIALNEIVYLKADNNTTDFYLENGRRLTAYKTLKYYENNLPSYFYRIHNSYIVNSNFVTRINTGKSLCYLNGNEVSVSFSKTFKDNIDAIIKGISPEYL